MSRKDYQAIANALNALGAKTHNWQAVALAANAIADTLAADNARFDRVRFLQACGVCND